MDVATIMSVAQTLFSALQCSQLIEVCSILGYESQLDSLRDTVITIKAVLEDADAKQELSNEAQVYIDRLKDAVYDADDLLDEFVTFSERKHQKLIKEGATAKGKVSRKMSHLFSRIKDLPFAYSMSQEVKKIRNKLDAIADNHKKYGFELDSQPIRRRREDTCSYVYEKDIIGRDADKEKIVDMLLNPLVDQPDVSFLTIVGIGGLGKTTLAQLVYNDQTVINKFPTRIWVCDGDEDTTQLNVNRILAKILTSITGSKYDESLLEPLQREVRKQLVEKKFLLILDDIWNENRNDWLRLEGFLKDSSRGSWVVITTRSSKVGEIVGDGFSYYLQGLSNVDSWCLFERIAFGQDEGKENPSDLVKIGHMIVEKCANVPLAIRVVGSLLYGQGKNKWESFQMNGLASINPKKKGILPILKCSYQNLESPLRSCFSYCALFPKDDRLCKQDLISLWMAQGYILPFDEGQSIEDAAEEYFSILLKRCFFQDVVKDEVGEIISCKIHDLMYNVAVNVAKKEVCGADCITNVLNNQTRHLSLRESMGIERLFNKNKLRTILFCSFNENIEDSIVDKMLNNCISLRALRLADVNRLPDAMGKLLHLRYLHIKDNFNLKTLPKSFTRFHNLETLILENLHSLVELPNDIEKLSKLRCLDIFGCEKLNHMPLSMGRLSSLQKLRMFVVNVSHPFWDEQWEVLGALKKLTKYLQIKVLNTEDAPKAKDEGRELGACLLNKQHLKIIEFLFKCDIAEGQQFHETLMENMQPHPNLECMILDGYKGEIMPSWGREDKLETYLPNLVQLNLTNCELLKHITGVGRLCHLKSLQLSNLICLEYVEENKKNEATGGEVCLFFPSLEYLELRDLPGLKEWWRGEGDDEHVGPPFLQSLHSLLLSNLPKLLLFPMWVQHLISLRNLSISFCNVLVSSLESTEHLTSFHSFNINCSSTRISHSVESIEDVTSIHSLPIDCENSPMSISHSTSDHSLSINCLNTLVSLSETAWLLASLRDITINSGNSQISLPESIGYLTSLRSLTINSVRCHISLPESILHLTSLHSLTINSNNSCYSLTINSDIGRISLPESRGLLTSLHSLTINCDDSRISLPESIGYFTSLHSLTINSLNSQISLPESLGHLTSLYSLEINSVKSRISLPKSIWHLTALHYVNMNSVDTQFHCQSQ